MNSYEYWKAREEEQLKRNLIDEKEYDKQLKQIYEAMYGNVQNEINSFYIKYARSENISLAEAKKRVSKLDIKAYERKAKRYVAEKNFSKQANEEMRLYNATMKINRLEMLKANIGLELIAGYDELNKFMEDLLQGRTEEELERQAGILGETIHDNAKTARSIVNASFQNATFSDRIWMYQAEMKAELAKLLQQGLIQGKNPRVLARDLRKKFDVSVKDSERLMRTELTRVQTGAQKASFEEFGYDEYTFICLESSAGTKHGTCDVCKGLNDKVFKVEDMKPALNAPPMHPYCRCSVAAYMDRDELKKNPTKQEIETTNIRLAGKKSSYHKYQKQLEEVESTAQENTKQTAPNILETIDYSDKNIVKSTLKKYEEEIVNSEVENAVVIAKDGSVYKCVGSLNGVSLTDELGDLLYGSSMTHNHPIGSQNEYSFSDEDWGIFNEYEIETMRGVDEIYEYELTRLDDKVDEPFYFWEEGYDGDFDYIHNVNIDKAVKQGIGYTRVSHEKEH